VPASIVIPQKTNSDMTLNLVLQIQHYEPDSEIIVVHDTQDDVMEQLPGCRMIRNRGVGVTAAWNHGIEEAKHEHVILLNNDVVCSGGFVGLLEPSGMLAGSLLVGATWRYERMLGEHVSLIGGASKQWLEGWCLSFYRFDWEGVGRFDESMVMYFSDLDFQWRVMKRGVRGLAAVDGLPLRHLGHQTTHQTPGIWGRWRKDRDTFKRKLEAMAR
jgi:GT2 family glycosyltransferase